MSQHWLIQDGFSNVAGSLRSHFDSQFADPRQSKAERFVWDYWHVPDQYTLLRTPAYHYFPKIIYEKLHHQLVLWGREILGCHDISPPWLSCYIDGCGQELHADHPHGPWAFVYSLTLSQKAFHGGETMILKPEVLSNWAIGYAGGTEQKDLSLLIKPRFNRLIVFDPRLPHGVRPVTGTKDPRLGRLVVHGWFVQPRPFWYGPLSKRDIEAAVDRGLDVFSKESKKHVVLGQSSWRLKISASGDVKTVDILTNTLVGDLAARRHIIKVLKGQMLGWRFRKTNRPTILTLPLGFGL
jgi:2OG-Fe(II) oxygenase superfamily